MAKNSAAIVATGSEREIPLVVASPPRCADWRDRDAYPADVTMAVIAWELRRRDEAYAEDFARVAIAAASERAELEVLTAAKWGQYDLTDPASPDPPRWRPPEPEQRSPLFAVFLDVGEPLTAQFKVARVDAAARRREWLARHPELRKKRTNKAKFSGFYVDLLQALDAVAVGARPDEICRVLWPHLDAKSGRDRLRYALERAAVLLDSDLAALATARN